MKVSVKRVGLIDLLEKVKHGVLAKASLPICKMVLLQTEKGLLRVTSNNLEESLSGSCMATVEKPGGVCVDPKFLVDFLKKVAGETVTLSIPKGTKGILKVEAGSTTATLEASEEEDFPPPFEVEGKATRLYELVLGLKEVFYAVAQEDNRPVLGGICFAPSRGKVELAGADGFRLAITSIKSHGTIPTKLIIPRKAIELLIRLKFDEADMRVMEKKVGEGEHSEINHYVSFHCGGLTLTVMAIRGNFPEYRQLIPKRGSTLEVDVEEIKKALGIVTIGKVNIVRLSKKGQKPLVLSTSDGDASKIETKVPAKGRVKIAFSPKYLKELLARLEGDMRMIWTDPKSPACVRQDETTHVLMPMFLNW